MSSGKEQLKNYNYFKMMCTLRCCRHARSIFQLEFRENHAISINNKLYNTDNQSCLVFGEDSFLILKFHQIKNLLT